MVTKVAKVDLKNFFQPEQQLKCREQGIVYWYEGAKGDYSPPTFAKIVIFVVVLTTPLFPAHCLKDGAPNDGINGQWISDWIIDNKSDRGSAIHDLNLVCFI